MDGWAMAAQGATALAVTAAVISLGVLLWQRPKRDAEVLFAVVSGSLAMSFMRPWVVDAPSWMQWAMAIGGCVTCNGFWLVSRALFRGEGGVGRAQIAIAAGMAALISMYRVVAGNGAHTDSLLAAGLGALLTFGGSAMLVLAFTEALRGWSPRMSMPERRLRIGFMIVFGSVVTSATLVTAMVEQGLMPAAIRSTVIGLCATLMIALVHLMLWQRRRHPLTASAPRIAANAEESALVEALRHQIEVLHVYREAELKISTLAERMGIAEHKLSRVITRVMGEKNFNQWLNRHRIAHACRVLSDADDARSILDISGDCGFASLGPFNRAFKAATGCTPSVWRARHAVSAQDERSIPAALAGRA